MSRKRSVPKALSDPFEEISNNNFVSKTVNVRSPRHHQTFVVTKKMFENEFQILIEMQDLL